MSSIIKPAKPDWKIEIVVDSIGQQKIEVTDLQAKGHTQFVKHVIVPPRQLNVLQVTALLSQTITNLMFSQLQMNQQIGKTNGNATEEKTNDNHG